MLEGKSEQPRAVRGVSGVETTSPSNVPSWLSVRRQARASSFGTLQTIAWNWPCGDRADSATHAYVMVGSLRKGGVDSGHERGTSSAQKSLYSFK